MKKTYLSLMLAIMAFASFSGNAFAANGNFAGGDGSSANPYQIEDCLDLQALNSFSDSFTQYDFLLKNDINCSDTRNWNNGAGFTPINTLIAKSLDGNGYKIDGLYISGDSYSGLFRTLADITVQNLGITNAEIHTNNYAGVLASGTSFQATISNVYVTGQIVASGSYIGGLIGTTDFGTVIENSYANVAVSGDSYIGGFIGTWNDMSTITNCYSVGKVTGSGYFSGGLIGAGGGFTSLQNSFYDTQKSGKNDNGKGIGKTTASMKNIDTFTNTGTSTGLATAWDFLNDPNDDDSSENIWNIDPAINNGYPYLNMQKLPDVTPPPAVSGLAASVNAKNVSLSWNYPAEGTEAMTSTIRRSTTVAPTSITDGTSVTSNLGTTHFTDENLSDGTYYYGVFNVDTAGNVSTVANATALVDTTPPTATITSQDVASGGTLNSDIANLTVTFSENVTGFILSDITVNGGITSAFAAVNSKSYTFKITGIAKGTTVNVSIPANTYTDLAGSANTSVASFGFSRAVAVVIEEPVVEEPVAEEPVAEEPVAEEPVAEEPVAEEPVAEEPVAEEPVAEEPVAEEPVVEVPVVEETNIVTTPTQVNTQSKVTRHFRFTDMDGHFAYDAVKSLYEGYIIDGRDTTHFAPDTQLTRAESVKLVLLAFGYDADEPRFTLNYTDLEETAWYNNYLRSGTKNEIINGYGDTTFKPNNGITRAEFVKIVLKAMKSDTTQNAKNSPFNDVTRNDWFKNFVNSAYNLGLVKGKAENSFAPNDNITRGEAAVILMRALSLDVR